MIAVTSRSLCGEPFLTRVARLAEARPEMIILREKDLTEGEYLALAAGCKRICDPLGVPLVVNHFVWVAGMLGIRRIHLPMPDLREGDVSGFDLVGASVHSVEEAKEAVSIGADYLIAGHVFGTACKPTEPRGLGFLRDVCSAVDVPVYAIGGVGPDNYQSVLEAGAQGAAVMSSAMTCDDPEALVDAMPSRKGRYPPSR